MSTIKARFGGKSTAPAIQFPTEEAPVAAPQNGVTIYSRADGVLSILTPSGAVAELDASTISTDQVLYLPNTTGDLITDTSAAVLANKTIIGGAAGNDVSANKLDNIPIDTTNMAPGDTLVFDGDGLVPRPMGDVLGPSAAVAGQIAVYADESGKVITTSQVTAVGNTLTADRVIANDVTINGAIDTATGTLSLPVTTDTLVGRDTVDTLTNKSIAGGAAGNDVSANKLAGTPVSGTAPAANQLLKFDGVQWAPAPDESVAGPTSSTTNALARYADTAGKSLKNSAVTVDDSGLITAPGGATVFSDRTSKWLTVTNGTASGAGAGNIVLQAPTSPDQGFMSLGFNGRVDGSGEYRYNTNKRRWRVTVDQRGAVDEFKVDSYAGAGADRTHMLIDSSNHVKFPLGLSTTQIINTGTLTLPTTTDTLVGRNTSDTLTNKTITGGTAGNDVSANKLRGVEVASTAPTNGQVLGFDGAEWKPITPTVYGNGDVTGPSAATANAVVRYDGMTGKLIKNSDITIDDNRTIDSAAGDIVIAANTHTQPLNYQPQNTTFADDRINPNYGASWSKVSSAPLVRVSISATGQYIVACGDELYISRDYGHTLTKLTPNPFDSATTDVAITANGQLIYVSTLTGVWRSTDYGNSFSTVYALSGANNIDCSDDGKYVVIRTDSMIYISRDFAQTFDPIMTGKVIAISGDGYTIATSDVFTLHISKDNGQTFSSPLTMIGINSIDVSYDGKYIILTATGDDGVYVSRDGGSTFEKVYSLDIGSTACALSANGRYMVSAYISGAVAVSRDYGKTWTRYDMGTVAYRDVSVSKTGDMMVASAAGSGLYICSNKKGHTMHNTLEVEGDTQLLSDVHIAGKTFATNITAPEIVVNKIYVTQLTSPYETYSNYFEMSDEYFTGTLNFRWWRYGQVVTLNITGTVTAQVDRNAWVSTAQLPSYLRPVQYVGTTARIFYAPYIGLVGIDTNGYFSIEHPQGGIWPTEQVLHLVRGCWVTYIAPI